MLVTACSPKTTISPTPSPSLKSTYTPIPSPTETPLPPTPVPIDLKIIEEVCSNWKSAEKYLVPKGKEFEEVLSNASKCYENVGKNLERLLAKTVLGLCTRIIAKMTSHLLKSILRLVNNIDVLTFSKFNA